MRLSICPHLLPSYPSPLSKPNITSICESDTSVQISLCHFTYLLICGGGAHQGENSFQELVLLPGGLQVIGHQVS